MWCIKVNSLSHGTHRIPKFCWVVALSAKCFDILGQKQLFVSQWRMMELHTQPSSFISLQLSRQLNPSRIFSEMSAVSWYFLRLKLQSNPFVYPWGLWGSLCFPESQFPHLLRSSSDGCPPLWNTQRLLILGSLQAGAASSWEVAAGTDHLDIWETGGVSK